MNKYSSVLENNENEIESRIMDRKWQLEYSFQSFQKV